MRIKAKPNIQDVFEQQGQKNYILYSGGSYVRPGILIKSIVKLSSGDSQSFCIIHVLLIKMC